jgi:hypothetical protein
VMPRELAGRRLMRHFITSLDIFFVLSVLLFPLGSTVSALGFRTCAVDASQAVRSRVVHSFCSGSRVHGLAFMYPRIPNSTLLDLPLLCSVRHVAFRLTL